MDSASSDSSYEGFSREELIQALKREKQKVKLLEQRIKTKTTGEKLMIATEEAIVADAEVLIENDTDLDACDAGVDPYLLAFASGTPVTKEDAVTRKKSSRRSLRAPQTNHKYSDKTQERVSPPTIEILKEQPIENQATILGETSIATKKLDKDLQTISFEGNNGLIAAGKRKSKDLLTKGVETSNDSGAKRPCIPAKSDNVAGGSNFDGGKSAKFGKENPVESQETISVENKGDIVSDNDDDAKSSTSAKDPKPRTRNKNQGKGKDDGIMSDNNDDTKSTSAEKPTTRNTTRTGSQAKESKDTTTMSNDDDTKSTSSEEPITRTTRKKGNQSNKKKDAVFDLFDSDSESTDSEEDVQLWKPKTEKSNQTIYSCTVCRKRTPSRNMLPHNTLQALHCKPCAKALKGSEKYLKKSVDEDGSHSACTWCLDGGQMLCCDVCNRAFCDNCFLKNGFSDLFKRLSDSEEEWKCFACNPDQLLAIASEFHDFKKDESIRESVQAKGKRNGKRKRLEKADDRALQKQLREEEKKLEEQQRSWLTEKKGTKTVLNSVRPKDEKAIYIEPKLATSLMPHQVEGVRFLWSCTIECIAKCQQNEGRGCILAHSMGLGKTIQVVTFLRTVLLALNDLRLEKAMVIVPKNVLFNWRNEFRRWGKLGKDKLNVTMIDTEDQAKKTKLIKAWSRSSKAVILISTTMFLTLSKKTHLKKYLLDPGPDILVIDEGHVAVANPKTARYTAIDRIKTRRRIVLTGTPLQNKLDEYHAMIAFVYPGFLSTIKDFKHKFAAPIKAGQHADASKGAVKLMKKRVTVLVRLLRNVIHRRGFEILLSSLPEKREYVVIVKLTDVQKALYKKCLELQIQNCTPSGFLSLYHILTRICVQPHAMEIAHERYQKYLAQKELRDELDEFIDSDDSESEEWDSETQSVGSNDDVGENSDAPSRGNRRKKLEEKTANSEPEEQAEESNNETWWRGILGSKNESIGHSCKFQILKELFNLLAEDDKVLLFSQSLPVLDLLEEFLNKYFRDMDYDRIDGSSSAEKRDKLSTKFNDLGSQLRVLLVSCKAGSLGANLVGANVVILMDTSFNPTHDLQAVFRSYRWGQKRPVSIYRLLTGGTVEEKVYRRQVEKQSLFLRVIDDKVPERFFTKDQLMQMLQLDEDDDVSNDMQSSGDVQYKTLKDPLPEDKRLAELLRKDGGKKIARYVNFDSLMQKSEETLTEEEKRLAWEEYENGDINLERENVSLTQAQQMRQMQWVQQQKLLDLARAQQQKLQQEIEVVSDPTLPEGWKAFFSLKQQRTYYYNQALAVTTWERPQIV
eukprot:m.139815 g.139815  ORF g.139815 m.139815 type:complete len:1308 (+) comp14812_c0_seq5:165-4088(+)